MKKILIASTALVAATVASAGAASASEKIKLELGGYSKWWVVGQWQDSKFQSNANAVGAQGNYNNVDIKGDNEIFFGGSTTLDNGLKVGINIELEAGGNIETKASNTAATDVIDKSVVFVEGGFGKVLLGTEANGAALLHVFAPDAAGNTDSDGILTGGFAVVRPTGMAARVSTSIDTDDNAEKITYVSPSFYGLTVGGTYVPNAGRSEDERGVVNLNTAADVGEIYGVGALYANTFGGLDVKVSGGWATYDVNAALAKSNVNEYTVGTQIGYAGFTVGGSFRKINAAEQIIAAIPSGKVWDAGIQYASGPYAISFIYFESTADAGAIGEDKFNVYQVSGKYALGPGVDALASVGHADYDGAGNNPQNENKGWAVMTGLSLAF